MNPKKLLLLTLSIFIFFTSNTFAEVTLPKILGHNMVLQRHKKFAIWGTAAPAEKYQLLLRDKPKLQLLINPENGL